MSDVPAPPSPPPPGAPPPQAAPPPPPPGAVPPGGSYPVSVGFDRDLEVARWRPLINWLLAFPHWVVAYFLRIVQGALWVISFFTILFAKRNPFVGFQTMVLRYQWRLLTYVAFMRNEYPPFDFSTDAMGGEPDPATLTVADPGEMNRWLVLVKWLLVIPHVIVLAILAIAAFVVWIIAFFAVLITGKWPEGLRRFVVGVSRWSIRVNAYFLFLTDEYPPFRLDP